MKEIKVFLFLMLVLLLQFTANAFSPGITRVEARESVPKGSASGPVEAEANATVLSGIEIKNGENKTIVHLKADGVIKDYRKFQLKKNVKENRPDRMYLDIKNVSLAGSTSPIQVGTALARVRIARRTNGARVVFDSSLEELFDYEISETHNGLLVSIREPSAENPAVSSMIPLEESAGIPEKVMPPAFETIFPKPKAEGKLRLVIATTDLPDHAREWLLAQQGSSNIGLKLLNKVKQGEDINTSFLVTGLTPDIEGNYSYATKFILLDPSGKPMIQRNFPKSVDNAPTHPAFIITEPELALVLDSTDPIGDYKIIGMVEDLTNNKIVRSSRKIHLTQ